MKILVFDIGGTAIKYGICQNGHLEETRECPTEAFKGGPHILNTICSLAKQHLPFDAIGISTAGQASAPLAGHWLLFLTPRLRYITWQRKPQANRKGRHR